MHDRNTMEKLERYIKNIAMANLDELEHQYDVAKDETALSSKAKDRTAFEACRALQRVVVAVGQAKYPREWKAERV